MKIRSLLLIVCLAASASILSPVAASGPPAKLLSRHSFTTGADGWVVANGGQLLRVADPVDPVLSIQGSATSPVPANTTHIQYHFRNMGPNCCDFTRLMRLENTAGDAIITVDSYSYTFMISGSTEIRRPLPSDSSWHRIDALTGTTIRILVDGIEMGQVAPAASGAVAAVTVASELDSPLRIDEVRLFSEGDVRQESFYTQQPISFDLVDRGTNGRQEIYDNVVSARDAGLLRIIGSSLPDEVHYVTWPIEDLGSRFESGVEFRNSNSFRPPDHFALLSGLSSSGEPLWAITISNALDLTGNLPVGVVGLFFVSSSRIDRLPYTFRGSSWRSLRASLDLDTGTVGIEVETGQVASIASLPSGTKFLATGDVFSSVGSPTTFDGLSPLGPTGAGTIDLDGLYSARL